MGEKYFIQSYASSGLRKLTSERFEALIGYTRVPWILSIVEEIWAFSDKDENVLGLLVWDKIDLDFSYILFARDANRRFRCFDLKASIDTFGLALALLFAEIKKYSEIPKFSVTQGDEGSDPINLFVRKENLSDEQLHSSFEILSNKEGYTAARELINEVMPHFIDIDDGQFLTKFQTDGFDQRLWELYLFCYFNQEKLHREVEFTSPDFILSSDCQTICCEATTLGVPEDMSVVPSITENLPEFIHYIRGKFLRALRKKLRKRYWELPHVANNPLLIAIADFHMPPRLVEEQLSPASLTVSGEALWQCLYGIECVIEYDEVGNVLNRTVPLNILETDRDVPYGFFNDPNSEHISAVLGNSVGTIAKFNRMGRLAGFGSPNVTQIVYAQVRNPDPKASTCLQRRWVVERKKYYEKWSTGVAIYHNPNAKIPLNPSAFPHAKHFYLERNRLICRELRLDWYPFSMQTFTFTHEHS